MNRIWLGAGVAAALLIGIVVSLTSGGDTTSTTTTVALATTTTAAPATTTTASTTTTTVPTTTTTEAPTTTTQSLEEREAEVLALVTDLEFRMYVATYDSDIEAIADLVGTQQLYDDLVDATTNRGSLFTTQPTQERFFTDLYAIELDSEDCLVTAIAEDATAFRADGLKQDLIIVLWPVEDALNGWRIAKRFGGGTPESSWLPECDLQNREWRP